MDQSRLGRGRELPVQNAWTARAEQQQQTNSGRQQQKSNSKPKENLSNSKESKPRKFEEACAEIQANVKKNLVRLAEEAGEESSSGDEDGNENDLDIISSVLNLYDRKSGAELAKTEQALRDSLKIGATVCLICISSVKKSEPIWTCSKCYCSLHLPCIQRWAKDSIFFQTEAASDHLAPGQTVDPKKFNWCCPKCRAEYPQQQIPTRYFCFCLKEQDPRFDPWLVPHSCGSKCEKLLQPECNHKCLLLCHPGMCPPCPQTVSVTCFCSKSAAQVRRCSSSTWSCGQKCSKLLSCRAHKCEEICHDSICPPCPRKSTQKCRCGRKKEERPCDSIEFQCDQVCGKELDCGHHNCQTICHPSKCEPCPLSLQRTCPCGKKAVTVACTVDVGGCGDTCGKLLGCGIHYCAERCHKGPCGTCWQMNTKRCRCGMKEKELPCYKEFSCETKCKRMKDCRRHPCNRKCCTGMCPPCDQPCNRPLGCKNHKCASRCHTGPCYPCPLTVDVTCPCKKTFITVPCGSERNTKPPKCSLPCTKPPDCHHQERTKHLCHPGSCPPCKQPCLKLHKTCGHSCPAPCHSSVLVSVGSTQEQQRAGPWEPKLIPRMEVKSLPCPPCLIPMPVTCIGGHETSDFPCYNAVPSSCARPCGRQLYCTNHYCSKPCHPLATKGPKNCEVCELPCGKKRPPGCTHNCARSQCHPGACPICTVFSKRPCHCTLNPQLVRCHELSSAIASGRDDVAEQLLSCKDRCPKLLPCGHRCSRSCHSGACPSDVDCVSTVTVSCGCKRLKKTVPCNSLPKWEQREQQAVECNDACRRRKEQELKAKEEKERTEKEEEERRNRKELEEFQRKFEKSGRQGGKERRRGMEPNSSGSKSVGFHLAVGGAFLILSIAIALWWMNSA